MNSSRGMLLLMFLILAGFLAGLAWVFAFQFQGGAAYPRASSLRADMGGSMILYESLLKQPEIDVRRNFESFSRIETPPGDTVLFVLRPFSSTLHDPQLQALVRGGARVVVTPAWTRIESGDEDVDAPEADAEEEQDEEESVALPDRSAVTRSSATAGEGRDWERAVRVPTDLKAPEEIMWRKGAVFREVEGDVLYAVEDQPVVVRLAEGQGEWIQLADPALLLNRAQYQQRETEWMSWLLGDARTVIFDESHFGITRPRGIMTLIRDAGLDVFLWALLLPLGLALWRASHPLLPPVPEDQEAESETLSRLDGYRDLLARHIPSGEILSHAFHEWRQDQPQRILQRQGETVDQAEILVEAPLPRKRRLNVLQHRFQQLTRLLNTRPRAKP